MDERSDGAAELVYPPGKNVAVTADGTVIPVGAARLSPSEIVQQIKDVVAMPYMGNDPDKIGMTLLEAALMSAAKSAADGDLDALTRLLDRLMGKPVQQTIQATGTLREFLDTIAQQEKTNE